MKVTTKDQALGHLWELDFILGADVIEKELVCFLSVDQLNEFIEHIYQMYDISEYENLRARAAGVEAWAK